MSTKQETVELSLNERLVVALKKYNVSQNRAGLDMGYTGSTISQWLSGNYKGDVIKVEEAIVKWLSRMEENAQKKSIPIVETSASRRMLNAIRLAHEETDIALIVGHAGSGKTTAAEIYKKENERNTILIKVNDSMNKRILTQAIAKELRIDTNKIVFNVLVEQVSESLASRDVVVIIDEADNLKDDALEFSRRLIFDLGQSGLVLIGLPKLATRIINSRTDCKQLESRIGVFLRVDGLNKADAEKIVKTVWEHAPSEITDAAYRIAQTDIRRFTKIINRTQNLMSANKVLEPDIELIEMAGSMILRRL